MRNPVEPRSYRPGLPTAGPRTQSEENCTDGTPRAANGGSDAASGSRRAGQGTRRGVDAIRGERARRRWAVAEEVVHQADGIADVDPLVVIDVGAEKAAQGGPPKQVGSGEDGIGDVDLLV